MKKSKITIPFIVLNCFAVSYLIWFYGDLLFSPNSYLFSQFGDGLKNYFTYAYHIRYGSSPFNFEGMNYPYGEHFLYTDCHPMMAYTLKKLALFFPSVKHYSIGILNSLLLSAQFFTFWVIYFLLRELKIKDWFAVLFSISIFLMAPQIERLGGHLALSYSIALPLSWWLLLKQQRSNGWFYTCLLLINNLFWLFTHAYLGIIVLSFLILISVLQFIVFKKRLKQISLILVNTLPILLFFIFTKLTDDHNGRTDNPTGFFNYYSELDNILIPSYGPLKGVWETLVPSINLEGEANAYIGFINVMLFATLIILFIISFFNSTIKVKLREQLNCRSLNISLISAFIVLLISMGIPFIQFPELLEYVPVVKQFRAVGRFTWPFFFAFSVFGAFYLQKLILYLIASGKKLIGIALVAMIFFFSFFETYSRHHRIAKSVNKKGNLFDENYDKDLQHLIEQIEIEKYQAIFSLPFYHHGSENFDRPRNDQAVQNTLVFAYHTGIPNIGANLTRSSIPESKKIVQLITPNYYPKPIQLELDSTRPFLLIHSDIDLTDYEKNMLQRAKQITPMKNGFSLYELTYHNLFKDQRQEALETFKQTFNQTIKKDSLYRSNTSSFFYFDDFEEMESKNVFQGAGAFEGVKMGYNTLAKFPPKTFTKGKKYQLKLWMFNNMQDALNFRLRLKVDAYNSKTNQWKNLLTLLPTRAEVIHGDWSLIEGEFELDDITAELFIQTKGKKNDRLPLYMDNLMIKEASLKVFKLENNTRLFYNNHLFDLP